MMDTIMNDIDCNAEELASSSYKPSATVEQLNKLFEYAPHEMGGKRRYEIEPPEQYYIQQHPKSKTYQHIQTFDPPLPSSFLCYLSIGYDALVAWRWEQDRRAHPERYNNQIKNQVMYVRHGFSEFFKPSDPITEFVDLIIDDKIAALPDQCRSLKLISINSAMNGCFFWGSGKSRPDEYQQKTTPRLDDSQIEVMATRGVHDMFQHRINLTHAQRISQTNDLVIRFKKIPPQGLALQIDGEAWMITTKCELRVQIHDKIPVVIGYNAPRGVESWLQASLDDPKITKAKQSFRDALRAKYGNEEDNNSLSASKGSASPHPPEGSDDKDSDGGSTRNGIVRRLSKANPFKPKGTCCMTTNETDLSLDKSVDDLQAEEEVEMKEMKKSDSLSDDKHVPNLPYFDPTLMNGDKSNAPNSNSKKRMMTKIGNKIKNKVRRNSVKKNASEPTRIETSHPYPQRVLDELAMERNVYGNHSNINGNINGKTNGNINHSNNNGFNPNALHLQNTTFTTKRSISSNGSNESKQSKSSNILNANNGGDEVDRREPMEVDFEEFLRQNPEFLKQHPEYAQSGMTADQHDQELFLERFTWWNMTRAKNHERAIDAEAAHDAITPKTGHEDLRKTKSFSVLPRKGSTASLF